MEFRKTILRIFQDLKFFVFLTFFYFFQGSPCKSAQHGTSVLCFHTLIQISCGFYHNIARDSNNKVYAWGANESYQCGDGTTTGVITPKQIDALKEFEIVDVKAGGYHNVAMTEDFEFFIWGANTKYACLNGNTNNLHYPTKFDPKANAEISSEVVLTIWPGYHATRVIVSRDQTKPVLGMSTTLSTTAPTAVKPQSSRTTGDPTSDDSKSTKNGDDTNKNKKKLSKPIKPTDPEELKKLAMTNYAEEMLLRKVNREYFEWFLHLFKLSPGKPLQIYAVAWRENEDKKKEERLEQCVNWLLDTAPKFMSESAERKEEFKLNQENENENESPKDPNELDVELIPDYIVDMEHAFWKTKGQSWKEIEKTLDGKCPFPMEKYDTPKEVDMEHSDKEKEDENEKKEEKKEDETDVNGSNDNDNNKTNKTKETNENVDSSAANAIAAALFGGNPEDPEDAVKADKKEDVADIPPDNEVVKVNEAEKIPDNMMKCPICGKLVEIGDAFNEHVNNCLDNPPPQPVVPKPPQKQNAKESDKKEDDKPDEVNEPNKSEQNEVKDDALDSVMDEAKGDDPDLVSDDAMNSVIIHEEYDDDGFLIAAPLTDEQLAEMERNYIYFAEYEYDKDFDTHGILYALGTSFGQNIYTNPAQSGLVAVDVIKKHSDSVDIQHLIGRDALKCFTEDVENAWFTVNFKDFGVCPTMYSLRHYNAHDINALRSWELQGSVDGKEWVTIKVHDKDSSLDKKSKSNTWTINKEDNNVQNEYFNMFRIQMTSKNDNGSWNLCCSGFEIYGKLRLKKSYTNFKSSFDTQGVLYNLGKMFGTNTMYKNPVDLLVNKQKLITLESTKMMSDSQPNKFMIGRDVSRCVTVQSQNAFFCLTFKGLEVEPTHYSLRHYNSLQSECIRNWVFEAKHSDNTNNDKDTEWTVLSEHINDDSIKTVSGAFTWELKQQNVDSIHSQSSKPRYFDMFRIRMTGPNDNGNRFLCCSGFEIYGNIRGHLALANNVSPEEKQRRLEAQQERERQMELINRIRAEYDAKVEVAKEAARKVQEVEKKQIIEELKKLPPLRFRFMGGTPATLGSSHYIIDTNRVKFEVEEIDTSESNDNDKDDDKKDDEKDSDNTHDPSLYVLPAIHEWGTTTLSSLSNLLEEITTYTTADEDMDTDSKESKEDEDTKSGNDSDEVHYKELLSSLKSDAEQFYSTNYSGFYSTSHSRCQMLLRWMQKYQDATPRERAGIETLLGVCVDILSGDASDISKLFFPTARIEHSDYKLYTEYQFTAQIKRAFEVIRKRNAIKSSKNSDEKAMVKYDMNYKFDFGDLNMKENDFIPKISRNILTNILYFVDRDSNEQIQALCKSLMDGDRNVMDIDLDQSPNKLQTVSLDLIIAVMNDLVRRCLCPQQKLKGKYNTEQMKPIKNFTPLTSFVETIFESALSFLHQIRRAQTLIHNDSVNEVGVNQSQTTQSTNQIEPKSFADFDQISPILYNLLTQNNNLRYILPNLLMNLSCLIQNGWENFSFLGKLSLELLSEMNGLTNLINKYEDISTIKSVEMISVSSPKSPKTPKSPKSPKGFKLKNGKSPVMSPKEKSVGPMVVVSDADIDDDEEEQKGNGGSNGGSDRKSTRSSNGGNGNGEDKNEMSTIIESPHPYDGTQVNSYKITFPKAIEFMVLQFDTRCATSQKEDYLEIFGGEKCTDRLFEKYKLKEWPQSVLMIPGNRIQINFNTVTNFNDNVALDSRWGFKVIVTGYSTPNSVSGDDDGRVRNKEWLLDLEKQIGYLGAMCASQLVTHNIGLQISEQRLAHVLRAPLFAKGIDSRYQSTKKRKRSMDSDDGHPLVSFKTIRDIGVEEEEVVEDDFIFKPRTDYERFLQNLVSDPPVTKKRTIMDVDDDDDDEFNHDLDLGDDDDEDMESKEEKKEDNDPDGDTVGTLKDSKNSKDSTVSGPGYPHLLSQWMRDQIDGANAQRTAIADADLELGQIPNFHVLSENGDGAYDSKENANDEDEEGDTWLGWLANVPKSFTIISRNEQGMPLQHGGAEIKVALFPGGCFSDANTGFVDFLSASVMAMESDDKLPMGRSQGAACRSPIDPDCIYLFGGYAHGGNECNTTYKYNVRTKEYTMQCPMKGKMRGAEAIVTPDDKIVLPSTYPTENYYIYDPKNDSWTSQSRSYGMSVGWEFQSCFDKKGVLHIVGGMSAKKKHITCQWNTKQWSMDSPQCPKGVICGGMVCGPDDKLYLFGGSDCANYSNILDEMWIYDLNSRQWSQGPSMPEKRCQFGYVNTGTQIVVLGGGTSYYSDYPPLFDNIFVFDFGEQKWTEIKCKLPHGNREMAAVYLNGKIHTFGGSKAGSNRHTSHYVVESSGAAGSITASSSGADLHWQEPMITDNDNGTYEVTTTIEASGLYYLRILINHREIGTSPLKIFVNPPLRDRVELFGKEHEISQYAVSNYQAKFLLSGQWRHANNLTDSRKEVRTVLSSRASEELDEKDAGFDNETKGKLPWGHNRKCFDVAVF